MQIHRVPSTHFGKGAKWRRIADFASFIVSCSLRLLVAPRHDVVIALTSPPLISFIGACLTRIKGGRFCYWVMDFNPDEAIAAGWLKAGSLPARVLDRMSQFSLRRADSIIALDRFMRDRIVAGASRTKSPSFLRGHTILKSALIWMDARVFARRMDWKASSW